MQECNTVKWRRVLFNVSACLLTSHPIPNVIFNFAPLRMVLNIYEDTEWNNVISNLRMYAPHVFCFLRRFCTAEGAIARACTGYLSFHTLASEKR